MHVDVEDLKLDGEIVAFWSEDTVYADYLMASFEPAREQSINAQERIRALLESPDGQ